jgi:hypothetical protein
MGNSFEPVFHAIETVNRERTVEVLEHDAASPGIAAKVEHTTCVRREKVKELSIAIACKTILLTH